MVSLVKRMCSSMPKLGMMMRFSPMGSVSTLPINCLCCSAGCSRSLSTVVLFEVWAHCHTALRSVFDPVSRYLSIVRSSAMSVTSAT